MPITEEIDREIPPLMASWKVPGMSIAIIYKDKIVFAKGYGTQQFGEDSPVTADTIFAIGSATKAFTAASLALLVDQGSLSFNTPLRPLLPEVHWNSELLTSEMTLADLLANRTGLEMGDLVWYKSGLTQQELIERLPYLKSDNPFRSTFSYNNLTYMIAGKVIPRVTGQSWNKWVEAKLLKPLHMDRTTTSVAEAIKMDNIASPHTSKEEISIIPRENNDVVAPAGAMHSSANDMANWLLFLLGKGSFEGKSLFSSKQIETLWEPVTPISMESIYAKAYPKATTVAYGLGWFLHDYEGHNIVEHAGKVDGMQSLVVLAPKEQFGFVILSNSDSLGFPIVLKYLLLDQFFDLSYTNWSFNISAGLKIFKAQMALKEMLLEKERCKQEKPG